MALRKILVGILTIVMISPAWGSGEPLGSITASRNATVRDTKLTPGSTVFTGDVISVEEHGGAHIAFAGGAQAEVLGNSSVRLTMPDNKIQMVVDRGQASFHTSGGNAMSALVGDAIVRPADGSETSAIIESFSETHAIVAAREGARCWLQRRTMARSIPCRKEKQPIFPRRLIPSKMAERCRLGKQLPRFQLEQEKQCDLDCGYRGRRRGHNGDPARAEEKRSYLRRRWGTKLVPDTL